MSNTVYVSSYLRKTNRGKPVYSEFKKLEAAGRLTLKEIPDNKNEWCRDYMPVKAADGKLVLFRYLPSYLIGAKTHEATIPDQKEIVKKLGISFDEAFDIILDGGAIEIYGKTGIIADKVVLKNASAWSDGKPEVLGKIKRLLSLEKLIVVPSDPVDFTGHVDGMVRFIDENTVLVNDMTGTEETLEQVSLHERDQYLIWKKNLDRTLSDAGFKVELLPCGMHMNTDLVDASGIYLNFLNLENLIIMPSFSHLPEKNQEAGDKLHSLYKKEVIAIEAGKVAKEGGIINCITWTE